MDIEKALQQSADLVAQCNPCGYFAPNSAPPGCKRKHRLMVARISELEAENKRLHSVVDPLIVEKHDAQEQRDRLVFVLQSIKHCGKHCEYCRQKAKEAIASLQADNQQQDEQKSGD